MLGWFLGRSKTAAKKSTKKKNVKKKSRVSAGKKPKAKPRTRQKVKRKTVQKKKRIKAKKSAGTKKVVRAGEIHIGTVNHYFSGARAAVFKVKRSSLAVGDKIALRGHTTDFKQKIVSMQVNRKPIQRARPGQEIGLEVKKRVRISDKVYRLS